MNQQTPVPTTYGPTEVTIDFGVLESCAATMDRLASETREASQHMHRAPVSPGAFGAMNMPLGTMASGFAARAQRLAADLAQASDRFARNTEALSKGWVTAEERAEELASQLAAALLEIDE